ncbi:NAD(P)/FAD-dependent oxidoreductase [Mangrovicoccus algicola]|uniref:FAD-dependent oxidoreductase n=1 Tax=Mangrovicoccus algicola TaxID=2771008 RepID=A0A8J6YWM0_9RHOB|nr:FAD-dependent oxidoreductase [Mangrovicoccus algicola]MBE3637609.1 FAD-dependent oxidoreductase [Mangrovicoccus algicola]
MARVVIIGAGHGGFQSAMSLRDEGFAGEILLIGAEPGLPYQRPPLSKAYLKTGDAAALAFRPEGFFEKKAITLRPGLRAEGIDRAAARVHAGGEAIAYDHLILATGAITFRPPVPGLERAHELRSLADAERLRGLMDRPRRIAVIGGGFIGLEFAAVARAQGHQVAVAEAADRLMARAVSPEISDRFRRLHEGLGTELYFGSPAAAVDGGGVDLACGTRLPADLVLLAAGVRPDTGLAGEAGLALENGIAADATLRTSDPQISALGDCASFPDPRRGIRIRLESVQAATDHARAIARRIVHGTAAPYDALPWFWSDQAEARLQIAGLALPADRSVQTPDGTVLRFDGDRLSAVESVSDPKRHMKARKLLAAGGEADLERLAAAAYDLAVL